MQLTEAGTAFCTLKSKLHIRLFSITSREEMEVLFTLLAEHYERGRILLTCSSNLPFSRWEDLQIRNDGSLPLSTVWLQSTV